MNSTESGDPNGILSRLLHILSEEELGKRIDAPIDRAVECFSFPEEPVMAYSEFLGTAARFIHHIHQFGLPVRRKLSIVRAKGEAFAMLSEYRGLHGNGVEAAWIDASLSYSGDVEPVLLQLREIVKMNQRRRHAQWIFTQELSRLDWRGQCRMVKALIQPLKEHLPPALFHCEPEQLVEQIPSLVQMRINSASQIRTILANNFRS
ncbi:MAG: hypothetical protein GC154_18590 [bacterium]|nr:hypothetical protein [bacterium]